MKQLFKLRYALLGASLAIPFVASIPKAEAATFESELIFLDPAQATPFPDPMRTSPFEKFDSTGKTITGVQVFLDGRLFGDVTFTNSDDGTNRQVTEYTQRGVLTARGPSGVPNLIQVFPQQTLVDFTNPLQLGSGESEMFDFDTTASQGPVSIAQVNWDLFVGDGGGSGEIDWSGSASALSDIDNGIDVETDAALEGTFRFVVEFEEETVAENVPEPTTLIGLLTIGAAGLVSRRRKS